MASAAEAVAESRLLLCPSANSSRSFGSTIGATPAFMPSTLVGLTSMPTTVCPSDTRQPAHTVPTYPRPKMLISMTGSLIALGGEDHPGPQEKVVEPHRYTHPAEHADNPQRPVPPRYPATNQEEEQLLADDQKHQQVSDLLAAGAKFLESRVQAGRRFVGGSNGPELGNWVRCRR